MQRRVLSTMVTVILLTGGFAWWLTRSTPQSEAAAPALSSHPGPQLGEGAVPIAATGRTGRAVEPIDGSDTVGPVTNHEFQPPDGRLRVRALDGSPGKGGGPVEGARVEILDVDLVGALSSEATTVATAITDEHGNGLLHDLPTGSYVLQVRAEGFADHARSLELSVPAGRDEQTALAHLLRVDEVIRGRVLRPDGRPISGALVCVDLGPGIASLSRRIDRLGNGPSLGHSAPHARSDESGRFDLALPQGFEQLALRICPGAVDLPAVFRYELDPPLAGPRTIVAPFGAPVVVRGTSADGSPTAGRLRVDSGEVVYDLEGDPVVARLLSGVDRRAVIRSPGELRLHLAPGGYTVRFYPDQGRPSASFLAIGEDLLPVEHVIGAGEDMQATNTVEPLPRTRR